MTARTLAKIRTQPRTHVTLRAIEKDGVPTYKLLGPEGQIDAFDYFVSAVSKLSYKTRIGYYGHIADAYDYLFEAAFVVTALRNSSAISLEDLRNIVDSWHEYLINGCESNNEIAATVAATLKSPLIDTDSSVVKHAPLRKLLRLSEQIRLEQTTMVKLGMLGKLNIAVDLNILYPNINDAVKVDRFERRALIKSTMLGGVLAGGPKVQPSKILTIKTTKNKFDSRVPFPFDKVSSFIENCPSYRDKAINSFLAASGCRQSEGMQLLFCDIETKNRRVKLVNPRSRADFHNIYASLTPHEKQKLSWKARNTSETFLIEPFASNFFHYLELYLRHEYLAHGKDEFVFQHLTSRYRGRPYFLSTPKTRSEAFYRSARGLDLGPEINGYHTFRHMYGHYLVNYFPRENGEYGLPIEDIQNWMGHQNISETMGYARKDKNLQAAALFYGNAMALENGSAKTLNELKIEALEAQINTLKKNKTNLQVDFHA